MGDSKWYERILKFLKTIKHPDTQTAPLQFEKNPDKSVQTLIVERCQELIHQMDLQDQNDRILEL